MNYILIPARLNSKRLPGKALLEVNGKALIHHTYNQCELSENADKVYIVTDSSEIINYCVEHKLNFLETKAAHNGTLRCAQVLKYLQCPEEIINVQLDYPQVCPDTLNYIWTLLYNSDSEVDCITAYYRGPITSMYSEDLVKLIAIENSNKIVWFSRQLKSNLIHIGIYGFRVDLLEKISNMEITQEAKSENLEQLTWLQNGINIHCFETEPTISINTQEDFYKFKKQIELSSGK